MASALDAQQLVSRPGDLAKQFSQYPGRLLAFVGIGFGPALTGTFDKPAWKGEFEESKHPRLRDGSPESGEFCSVDNASNADNAADTADSLSNQNSVIKELTTKIGKRVARKALRNRLVAGLRFLASIVADVVPVAGEIFDAYEIGATVADGIALEKDVTAAMNFVNEGPRLLENLQMEADYRPFSSFDAFKKDLLGKNTLRLRRNDGKC